MVVEVLSPNRSRGKKRKLKQSKIQIHGEKNKLVVKLPEEESESSSGHKKTAPRATSSPVVIDLGTESDKSSKSANSSKSGRKTRNSSKQKADPAPDPKEAKKQKKAKKEEKKKMPKGASDKGKQNGSAPAKPTNDQPKEDTLDAFLKRKDLTKWYDFIDMLSPEDIEAIDIIITQRRNEEEEDLAKEIKKEEEDEKPVLKDGKQTDGSCDRTTGSGTDATDPEEGKHKKRIRRKLNKEFIVYVGEEKKKMHLVECTDSNSLSETTQSEEEAIDSQDLGSATNSNSEENASNSNSEESNKISNSEESEKSDSNATGSDKSGKNSNSEESTKESEESVEEIPVPPKEIPVYDVESSNSENTDEIYKSLMDGSKLSLATVSTISIKGYTQSDESDKNVETVKNVGMSSTVGYSDSSVEIVCDRSKEDGKASDGSKNEGVSEEDRDSDVSKQKEIIDGGASASDGFKNTRSDKEMDAKEGVQKEIKDGDQKEIKDSDRSDSTSVTDSTDSPTETTDVVTNEKKKEFHDAFGPQTEYLDKS